MVVQKSMPISLPTATVAKVDLDRKVPLTITADGTVYVEQEAISMDVLVRRLQVEMQRDDKLTVIVRADTKVPYGTFVYVLDTLKKAGITRISIATEDK